MESEEVKDMMCETCLNWAGDGEDNTIRMIVGHHPRCPDLKIDRSTFCEYLNQTAQRIADKMLIAEMPKLKAMYEPKPPKVVKGVSERRFQEIIYRWRQKAHSLIAPNVKLFCGEADLVSVSKTRMLYEFEIKISKADFKKDFTKSNKHKLLAECFNTKERIAYSDGRFMSYPNYFYYVAPAKILDVGDIPDYAGLIEIHNAQYPAIKLIAPRIHEEQIQSHTLEKLLSRTYACYWNQRMHLAEQSTIAA